MTICRRLNEMRPPYFIQTIDRLFWTGSFWHVCADRAKLFQDRGSAVKELERYGQTDTSWLIRPACILRTDEPNSRVYEVFAGVTTGGAA